MGTITMTGLHGNLRELIDPWAACTKVVLLYALTLSVMSYL